jgi:hypothetical protein
MTRQIDRRKFIRTAASGGVAAGIATSVLASSSMFTHAKAPAVRTQDKTGNKMILGDGDYQYKIDHAFLNLPGQLSWQTTHNVAVDSQNRIYVIHEGRANRKDHPCVMVFDDKGKYIRGFGQKYQGGGHGLEVRKEGNEEFLYVTTVVGYRVFAKLTLDGEEIWERRAPMQTNLYAEGDDVESITVWGKRDNYKPTNIAFLDDGGFFVADGYGAYVVHRHDAEGNYLSTIGEVGRKDGQFLLPHGLWIDSREGQDDRLVVADRANNRLQWFSIDGKHLKTQGDYLLPANIDQREDLLLVPELQARITLVGPNDQVVARLGDDAEYRKVLLANKMQLRTEPDNWQDGRLLHPHDACFDLEGNIIVAEWVKTGRVSKLTRV